MGPDFSTTVGAQDVVDVSVAELRQAALDHVWIHSTAWDELNKPDGFKIIVEGSGSTVVDSTGRRYIDAVSGLWCVNVGYGRAEIASAMQAQAVRVPYTRASGFTNLPAIRLAAKLASMTPGSLSRCFFTSGGTESVESAIKIARQYHHLNGQPTRHKIIGRRYSYHGASIGAMALSSSLLQKRSYFEPLPAGFRHTSAPYCYRCDYEMTYPSCRTFCARTIEKLIQFEGPDTVAAILTEPISNSLGVIVPPDEYWPILREICDKYGVLLITDEVVTGFGRTGKMFAMEHWGVVPDIMTVAKGLSSAYAPIGAAIARKDIADKFQPGKPQSFQHVVTFGGHAVACAAALANIEILERENLVENAAQMGKVLLDGLRTLSADHPTIGDVRGLGLMCGVEIVKDRASRASFDPDERPKVRQMISQHFDEAGIIVSVTPTVGDLLPIMPPLCVRRAEIDQILAETDRALAKVEAEFRIR